MNGLPPYKASFLKRAIEGGVLKFGTFELKSKRLSPYFFNAGLFYTAPLLHSLGDAFARTIMDSPELEFDVVFGPAYKGIPLSVLAVHQLGLLNPEKYQSLCYAFDRKEAKDHGEGGSFVGAPMKGKRVLVVDDVVTDGAAKREAIDKIRKAGGTVVGIVVAVDRMERLSDTEPGPSGIGALRKEYGLPILAILTLDDIVCGMKDMGLSEDEVKRIEEYRGKYKADDN
jgi:orotate phosphoribosyltransferase